MISCFGYELHANQKATTIAHTHNESTRLKFESSEIALDGLSAKSETKMEHFIVKNSKNSLPASPKSFGKRFQFFGLHIELGDNLLA